MWILLQLPQSLNSGLSNKKENFILSEWIKIENLRFYALDLIFPGFKGEKNPNFFNFFFFPFLLVKLFKGKAPSCANSASRTLPQECRALGSKHHALRGNLKETTGETMVITSSQLWEEVT